MHSNTYKLSNARLFSDLMKCSVEHESLSKNNWYVLSKRKRLWIKLPCYVTITLQSGECLTSYDVTSLFPSVPIDPALNIIKDLLEKDK